MTIKGWSGFNTVTRNLGVAYENYGDGAFGWIWNLSNLPG
jgi:hypothetical protein